MKLNENQFFIIAVSLIEQKQRLLKENFDKNVADLVNDIDTLLFKLQSDQSRDVIKVWSNSDFLKK